MKKVPMILLLIAPYAILFLCDEQMQEKPVAMSLEAGYEKGHDIALSG